MFRRRAGMDGDKKGSVGEKIADSAFQVLYFSCEKKNI